MDVDDDSSEEEKIPVGVPWTTETKVTEYDYRDYWEEFEGLDETQQNSSERQVTGSSTRVLDQGEIRNMPVPSPSSFKPRDGQPIRPIDLVPKEPIRVSRAPKVFPPNVGPYVVYNSGDDDDAPLNPFLCYMSPIQQILSTPRVMRLILGHLPRRSIPKLLCVNHEFFRMGVRRLYHTVDDEQRYHLLGVVDPARCREIYAPAVRYLRICTLRNAPEVRQWPKYYLQRFPNATRVHDVTDTNDYLLRRRDEVTGEWQYTVEVSHQEDLTFETPPYSVFRGIPSSWKKGYTVNLQIEDMGVFHEKHWTIMKRLARIVKKSTRPSLRWLSFDVVDDRGVGCDTVLAFLKICRQHGIRTPSRLDIHRVDQHFIELMSYVAPSLTELYVMGEEEDDRCATSLHVINILNNFSWASMARLTSLSIAIKCPHKVDCPAGTTSISDLIPDFRYDSDYVASSFPVLRHCVLLIRFRDGSESLACKGKILARKLWPLFSQAECLPVFRVGFGTVGKSVPTMGLPKTKLFELVAQSRGADKSFLRDFYREYRRLMATSIN